ncbi:MAG TPA: SCO family protein [Rhizomicrobium sp.]|nr:SCO family protein [Rhizomicrobium sp.]
MPGAAHFITKVFAFALMLTVAGCGRPARSDTTSIAGVMPRLAFAMIRANDDAAVTAANYRGKAVLLYFGYTHCPDECPTTLANLASALKLLGPNAERVRVLFVTVDPSRDTIPALKSYVKVFAPQIDGLRGSANAVEELARRYRVIYEVTPVSPAHSYSVMHSDSVFMFDGSGRAQFVTLQTNDTAALARRIAQLGS